PAAASQPRFVAKKNAVPGGAGGPAGSITKGVTTETPPVGGMDSGLAESEMVECEGAVSGTPVHMGRVRARTPSPVPSSQSLRIVVLRLTDSPPPERGRAGRAARSRRPLLSLATPGR